MQKDGGEDCLPKLSKLKPNRKFPMEVFYKQCLSLLGIKKANYISDLGADT